MHDLFNPGTKTNRRQFQSQALGLAALPSLTAVLTCFDTFSPTIGGKELQSDLVIIGGSLGGCAAALSALRNGLKVIMTEETDWIGGQLTSQGVPPDEHKHIESHGANRSYRQFRNAIRDYYRKHYRLTEQALNDPYFNPGRGSVSRLCCEPKVALNVLQQLFQPYINSGQLNLLLHSMATSVSVTSDNIDSVEITSLLDGERLTLVGKHFIDATETGELLPLAKMEWITGAESAEMTGELHAARQADPNNQQAFTVCFALDYQPDADHRIDKPDEYDFWREFTPNLTPAWSGKLLDLSYSHPRTLQPKLLGFDPSGKPMGSTLNLWNYRRIIDQRQFLPGQFSSDISLINWPQNDYFLGHLLHADRAHIAQEIERAKQLSLSLLYWLQTEAPRPDGGFGFQGLRLRRDVMGTEDGLAKAPYIRESRRIVAEFTVLESHVGKQQRSKMYSDQRGLRAEQFEDSVGVGSYPIDIHPTTAGDNYIDFETFDFQIPLGSLLPIRIENLLPACKNIGTTHLTSGCYRLHPVEWGIGEAAGCLSAYALQQKITLRAVRSDTNHLGRFQQFIRSQGVETHWKE